MMTGQLALILKDPWLPDNFDYTTMGEDERRVYNALYYHRGAEQAITIDDLAAEAFPFRPVSWRNRMTRRLLKQLTEDRKVAIATNCHGVYFVESADELLNYTANLTHRAMSILKRAASLRKISLPVYLGQLRAEFDNTEGEINGKSHI